MMVNSKNKFSPISILNWNANGITHKFTELKDFIIDNNVDICIITETHTSAGNSLKMANYHTYKCDRLNRRGGGTAILAKRSLHSSLVKSSNDKGFEEITISLSSAHDNTRITAVYNPPTHILTDSDIDYLFPKNSKTILGGDLNAKNTIWGCRGSNNNGKALHKHMGNYGLKIIAPLTPTYVSNSFNHRPDILDIFLTNYGIHMSVHVLNELSSDHLPVIATVGIDKPLDSSRTMKTDWQLYHNILKTREHVDTPLVCPLNIDEAVKNFTLELQSARTEASSPVDSQPSYHILPKNIKKIIKYRNWVRKRHQKTLDPKFKIELLRLNREIKELCNEHRQSLWEEKVVSLCTSDQSVWKMSKSLRQTARVNRPIQGINGMVFSDEEKAEAFADEMEGQFKNNSFPSNPHFENIVGSEVSDFLNNPTSDIPIDPTNLDEISFIISKLKNRKAPGIDNINNSMLKNLPDISILKLLQIINACLKIAYFPLPWKKASIIMIQKPLKSPCLPSSYRPISLLPSMAKVYERILNERIRPYLSNIPTEQYGFLKGKSTTHQLVRILEFTGAAAHNKVTTAMLMLDVSKAFDRVWHTGLIKKLIDCQLPSNLIVTLHSYLSSRSFTIKFGGALSSPRPIEAGVPQGSILGPVLYLFYTYDFPTFKNDPNSLTAFYADDTAIVTKSVNPNHAVHKLTEKVPEVESWCKDWKVAINAQKSNILVIRKTKRHNPITTDVQIFGESVPIVKKANYLGLTISDNLTWKHHITNVTNKAKAAMTKLRPLLGRRSKLPLNLKRLLYLTTIRPILTYASPAIACLSPSDLKKLQICQNKIMREMVDAHRYVRNNLIHRDLKIETIGEHMAKLNVGFYKRALSRNNDFCNSLQYEVLREDIHIRPFAAFSTSDAVLAMLQ